MIDQKTIIVLVWNIEHYGSKTVKLINACNILLQYLHDASSEPSVQSGSPSQCHESWIHSPSSLHWNSAGVHWSPVSVMVQFSGFSSLWSWQSKSPSHIHLISIQRVESAQRNSPSLQVLSAIMSSELSNLHHVTGHQIICISYSVNSINTISYDTMKRLFHSKY